MPVLTGSDIPADSAVAAFARDAVIGIADFAARSLGGGKPPTTAARDAAAPPADPLLDLRLPESLRAWLKPAADALGLTIEDGNARDKYGRAASGASPISPTAATSAARCSTSTPKVLDRPERLRRPWAW